MNKSLKKLLSAVLTMSMIFSMVPMVFAEGETETGTGTTPGTTETTGTGTETTPETGTGTAAATVNAAGSVYISNYAVVDANGGVITKLTPGQSGIIAVTVIDERIPAELLTGASGTITNQIHATMTQGAFSLLNPNDIQVRMRAPVNGKLCYTVEFRGATYVGGDNTFTFVLGYSAENGAYEKTPFAVEQKVLSLVIAQAVDDVPAPNIILNNASYGGTVSAGSTFTLSTSAMNTSDSLELENVTVQVILPQGLSIASGNSQYLIGKVGKKGTISQSFVIKSDAIQTETTTLPVSLHYTFEALVNGRRQTFTSEQQISVNLTQPTRFEITSLDVAESMYTGNTEYCTIKLVNKGKSTVYNVTAELVSDDFTGRDVEFIGNLRAGTQNETEFTFSAMSEGTGRGKIVVTFEDATGNENRIEKEFEIEVYEMQYTEPTWTDPVVVPEEKNNKGLYIGIGAAAAALAAGAFYFRKKKAKRLAELEDEDEDI